MAEVLQRVWRRDQCRGSYLGRGARHLLRLFRRDRFDSEWVENSSVTPLRETVKWIQKYRANFQPASEMMDEMYELDLGVEYWEST